MIASQDLGGNTAAPLSPSPSRLGFVVTCASDGLVHEVLSVHGPMGLTISPGSHLADIGQCADPDKLKNFIQAVTEDGVGFGWELVACTDTSQIPINMYGVLKDDHILVIGASSDRELLELVDELASTNNDLVNTVRDLKRQMARLRDSSGLVDSSVEELSAINNELVNLQRELQRRNAEVAREQRFISSLIAAAPNVIYVYDVAQRRITFVNDASLGTLGLAPDEIMAMDDPLGKIGLRPQSEDGGEWCLDKVTGLKDGQRFEWSNEVHTSGGRIVWIRSHATVLERGEDGSPSQVLVVGVDLTHEHSIEEQLRTLALHDQLTGLLNRSGLEAYAANLAARAVRNRETVGVLFADLDGLKEINDDFGHPVGDVVMVEAAAALASSVRASDLVARVGGDEFVILVSQTSAEGMATLAERIRTEAAERSAGLPHGVALSLSLGFICSQITAPEAIRNLINRADRLMYEDKAARRASGAYGESAAR